MSRTSDSISSRKLAGYVLVVAGLTTAVRLVGFVEKQVLAYFFGVGASLDVYVVAVSVPLAVFFTVAAVVEPAFLPMFVRRLRGGDEKGAWGQFNAWSSVILIILIIGAGCGFLYAEQLVSLLAPGFSAERQHECVKYLWILVPVSVAMGLLPLLTSTLNARRRFAVPLVADITMKTVPMCVLLALVGKFGFYALIYGVAAGIVLGVIVLASSQWGSWFSHRSAPDFADADFRLVFRLMLILGAGALFSRIGTLAENAACSSLPSGAISSLEFARKIMNLPLMIVSLAYGKVLYTVFAELVNQNQHEEASRHLAVGLRLMLFIFLPLSLITSVLSRPIVAVIYQRGQFDAQATELVSGVLFWLAPTMCLLAIEALLMRHFFSRADMWPPTLIGVGCVILRIVLLVSGVGVFGIVAVAGAIFLSRAVKIVLLVRYVCRRGGVTLRQLDLGQSARLLLAAIAASGLVALFSFFLGGRLDTSLLTRTLWLAMAGALGMTGYLFAALLLGSHDCQYLFERLKWKTARQTQ